MLLRDFMEMYLQRPLTYAELTIADKIDTNPLLQPSQLRMHVGRVPRALVGVQRRGGRGTP
jgi:hypothetical protein